MNGVPITCILSCIQLCCGYCAYFAE